MNIKDMTDIVSQVENLSKSMDSYGIGIVVISFFMIVFLLAILYFIIMSQKNLKSYIQDRKENQKFISDQNADLIKALLEELHSDREENQQHTTEENDSKKNFVGMYIHVSMAFKDACKSVLSELNADRVGVYIFHNGNHSIHGLPFFKMSCVGEYSNTGIMRGKCHIDLPLHLFNDMVEKIYKNNIYSITDISSVDTDLDIIRFVEPSRAKSVFMVGIRDYNNNLAGFSIVEFNENNTFNDKDIKNINSHLDIMNEKIRDVIINCKLQDQLEKLNDN